MQTHLRAPARACSHRSWSTPGQPGSQPGRSFPGTSPLLLSLPLHFGDYGGLPMKVLWAALDVATIVDLGSGVHLRLKRRPPPPRPDFTGSAVAG